jgi:hypothetical protein
MRRYLYSKQAQGDRYLRDRNLLVSPATLKLTEEFKLKARRNQVKEDAKRVLKSKHTFTITTHNRSTQTDNDQFNLLKEDDSDTSRPKRKSHTHNYRGTQTSKKAIHDAVHCSEKDPDRAVSYFTITCLIATNISSTCSHIVLADCNPTPSFSSGYMVKHSRGISLNLY